MNVNIHIQDAISVSFNPIGKKVAIKDKMPTHLVFHVIGHERLIMVILQNKFIHRLTSTNRGLTQKKLTSRRIPKSMKASPNVSGLVVPSSGEVGP